MELIIYMKSNVKYTVGIVYPLVMLYQQYIIFIRSLRESILL